MPSVDEVMQKVQRILAQSFSTRLGTDDDFFIDRGSTSCRVSCESWIAIRDSDGEPTDDHHVLVNLRAPVLFDVPITDELCRWIALEGTLWYFGTPVIFPDEEGKDGNLYVDHSLLGTFLDSDELKIAVTSVLGRADRLDDELQGRFGGRRLSDPSESE